MSTVAEVLVQSLMKAGVKRIYGIPGDSLNAMTESLRTHESLTWVHTRNEEAAAFAATAEAHLTKRLAVCAGSCGPGNLHLINGLYDAQRSRVPVLAIAAQIPSTELGTNYFQETNPEALFKDCSDYIGVVSEPAQLPRILGIAMRSALTRRSVSVIVISGNVAMQSLDAPPVSIGFEQNDSMMVAPLSQLEEAATLLNGASKVTILGGAGCEGAHGELIELARTLQAPIVHALRGKEFIEYENPFDVGMTGLIGFSSGFRALMQCEVLLMLGSDFPYTQFFPKKAKVIQVDLRGEQLGRRTHVDVGIIGSVKNTITSLMPLLEAKSEGAFLKKSIEHYRDARKALDELATPTPDETPMHPQYVTRVLDGLAADDAIFTCDVGTPTVWAARYLTMNGRRRLVGSFNHGTMATALPHALGASAATGKQVIALCGDGGLAMLMGELLTAKQNKLPVKLVVFNNASLGFVELEMKATGYLPFGTGLENPDFAAIATACGFFGQKVTSATKLEGALREALAHDGPALVDVSIARSELTMPPSITAEQAKGFGLYVMQAVMSGRGDELVDLAKTNFIERIFGT